MQGVRQPAHTAVGPASESYAQGLRHPSPAIGVMPLQNLPVPALTPSACQAGAGHRPGGTYCSFSSTIRDAV